MQSGHLGYSLDAWEPLQPHGVRASFPQEWHLRVRVRAWDRARLVPARVAVVAAEDEEERERGHEDGEGQRGQHEGGEASARVHDAAEVLVAAAERIEHHDEERDQRHEGQLLGERLIDAAARQRAHVAQETVARPVADPVVVHEDGAAVLPIVLGVGLTLLPPRLAVALFRWGVEVGVRERGPSGDILRI